MHLSNVNRCFILVIVMAIISLTAVACAKAELELGELSISPSEVSAGEEVTISVLVSNVGDEEGTFEVTLEINDEEVDSQQITVPEDAARTVSFTRRETALGTYRVEVHDRTGTFTVVAPAPEEFIFSNLVVSPAEVTVGEEVTISTSVQNVGGKSGWQTVILTIDGTLVETKGVNVSPGATQTVTFTVVTDVVGSHEIAIGGLSGTLSIVGPAEFNLSSLVISPPEVHPGENAVASVDITNIGEVEGNYKATLMVGDSEVQTEEITTAVGQTRTVSFSVVIDEPGTHLLSIGGASANLKVLELVHFEVSSLVISPAEVLAGWGATITADVTNTSDTEASYKVTLKVKRREYPGARKEVDSKELILAGGAKETVSFSLVEEDGGRYEVEVNGLTGTLLVKEGALPTLHVGDQWAYRESAGAVLYTRTETITGEEMMEGKECYVVKVTYSPPLDGWIPERTEWWDKATLDLVRLQFSAFEPTIQGALNHAVVISTEYTGSPWPKTAGRSYTVTQSTTTTDVIGGQSSTETTEPTIRHVASNVEEVEVRAGTFKCVKILQFEAGIATAEYWYSDKAKAVVKYSSLASGDSWELLSYSVENGAL